MRRDAHPSRQKRGLHEGVEGGASLRRGVAACLGVRTLHSPRPLWNEKEDRQF